MIVARIEKVDGVSVGGEKGVEVAIPVVVGEGHHDPRTFKVEAEFCRLVAKDALAVVNIEPGGAIEPAKREIEISVVVDVGEGGARRPIAFRLVQPCRGSDVFKLKIAEIAIEAGSVEGSGQEDIGPSVAIDISDGHAATSFDAVEELDRLSIQFPAMDEIHPGSRGID